MQIHNGDQTSHIHSQMDFREGRPSRRVTVLHVPFHFDRWCEPQLSGVVICVVYILFSLFEPHPGESLFSRYRCILFAGAHCDFLELLSVYY